MKKWNIICSANSKEELENMINAYYCVDDKDFFIQDKKDDETYYKVLCKSNVRYLEQVVIFHRNRWQFGYFSIDKQKNI